MVAGYQSGIAWPYALGVAAFTGRNLWDIARVRLEDRQSCHQVFRQSQLAGWSVTAGILISSLFAHIS
jgi:4-hydroxybenzoate polyprenyltransferase